MKKLLESIISEILDESLEEPLMIDAGGEAERQSLLRSVISNLAETEETRERLLASMKQERDPVQKVIYQQALESFNNLIKDQHEIIRTLAKGTASLRSRPRNN